MAYEVPRRQPGRLDRLKRKQILLTLCLMFMCTMTIYIEITNFINIRPPLQNATNSAEYQNQELNKTYICTVTTQNTFQGSKLREN